MLMPFCLSRRHGEDSLCGYGARGRRAARGRHGEHIETEREEMEMDGRERPAWAGGQPTTTGGTGVNDRRSSATRQGSSSGSYQPSHLRRVIRDAMLVDSWHAIKERGVGNL